MFIPQGPVLIIGKAKSGEAVAALLRASHPNLEVAFYDDDAEKSDFVAERGRLKRGGAVVHHDCVDGWRVISML